MLGIDRLTRLVQHVSQKLDHITEALCETQERLSKMPTRAEFDEAMESLRQAIADETAQVTADIQALRDKLASGVTLTDADLAAVQSRIAEVKDVDPDAAS